MKKKKTHLIAHFILFFEMHKFNDIVKVDWLHQVKYLTQKVLS